MTVIRFALHEVHEVFRGIYRVVLPKIIDRELVAHSRFQRRLRQTLRTVGQKMPEKSNIREQLQSLAARKAQLRLSD